MAYSYAMLTIALRFNLKRDASPLATFGGRIVETYSLRFNLKRDASPLATQYHYVSQHYPSTSFNLKRDASPLATRKHLYIALKRANVSISSEMPAP